MKKPQKVITSTADKKKFDVLKGSSDTRQIRCVNKQCRNMAVQSSDGKGGTHYKCQSCGKIYKFVTL